MTQANDAPPRQRVGAGRVGAGRVGVGEEARDTRSRIQAVALELFIEQGYEQTSLREIAERLGVTKAALYYHFRTKDDIIDSLVQDRIDAVEELIAWAHTQPPTVEMKQEFLRRYSEELRRGRHHDVMRLFERNQASMKDIPSAARMRERMADLVAVLSPVTDPLPARIRCSLALLSLHATWFIIREPEVTDDQRREAALQIARELVEGAG
jgi:AcrR family transcriptional regulator